MSSLKKWVVVRDAGTDIEFVLKSFDRYVAAIAFVIDYDRDNGGTEIVDILRRNADGQLTTEY
jgi:hypothetical protein